MFELYLKSLEIQGFKSFPSITRLTFDKPITGIVGPNGSGKSNISDAILWVMGEQSTKTLRGNKMEDVIFGGTLRKNQMGFAQVSLILDNSEGRLGLDTTEVMLTRRYYRTGESTYYINQKNVRLKEVNDLLMDTGLGREGYSIIGQGKIDGILSTKSKDRRDIFEEAAGISRYRFRKDISERKLQQTEENLLRVGDKISELEPHRERLREQAEVAKKYIKFKDELKGLEVSLWLNDLETYKTRLEKAKTDHRAAIRDFDAAKQQNDSFQEQSSALTEMTQSCNKEAESIRETISESEGLNKDVESTIAVLMSQLESNNSQIESISNELKSQDENNDGVGAQINDNEERLKIIEDEKSIKDEKIKLHADELFAISKTSGESSEAHSKLIKEENDIQIKHSDKKAEFSALASQAQELYDMENSVGQELAAAKDELKTRENDHTESKNELKKAQEEVSSLENVIKGLTIKAENRSKKAETAGENLDRLTFELKTLQSKKDVLSEMEKEYKGYSESVQLVMKEASRGALKNIHGTVGGLLKTDDIYAVAIETALGYSMQNIIVATDEDGKTAINFLKRREGGRATFLPISTIKGDAINKNEFSSDKGFEGIALSLVSYEPKYKDIYTNLLGRVIIADNIDNALVISKKHNRKYKVVTLGGQVINAGGSMTGGSMAKSVGMLSRANELEQLGNKIKSCESELSKIQREHAECVREKTAAEYELNTALDELRIAQDEVKKQQLEESHREQILQTLRDKTKSFDKELESITKRIENNAKEKELLKKQISKLETEAEKIKIQIEDAIRGHEVLEQERERVNTILAEIRTEIATLDAESKAILKSITDLSKFRDDLLGSRERQLDNISKLKSRNEQISKEITQQELNAAKALEEIEIHKKRLSEVRNRLLKIEKQQTDLNKAMHDSTETLLLLKDTCANYDVKTQSIKMEETQILDKLWDSYALTPTGAKNASIQITNTRNAQKRINVIKREMTALGNPNLDAIEQYEETNSRFEFLTSQRDDVEKAKADLLRLIDDITAEMRGIFTTEFAAVNESFQQVFKDLFNGGRASLILEDPNDVLNCGIDIQAQPPGKQLKTISLLSGGEKALVAIAIYFAILSVRPPPFVVMDEIDAALDDANAQRFADYMRRMSDKTQMVVISHKRRTMEEADILYGVTMQELGISSLLRVDLEEAEQHIKSKSLVSV